MKKQLIRLGSCLFLFALVAGAVEKAEAASFSVSVSNGGVQLHYDSAGIPIWGYAGGRPIYAYSPEGAPIYVYNGIYSGCRVPHWDPLPCYHGPRWPQGIHRGHAAPPPPQQPRVQHRPHPGPRPGAHHGAPPAPRHGGAHGAPRPGGHPGPRR